MPYDPTGEWIDVSTIPLRRCTCSGCREYERINGIHPDENYLRGLTEPVYNLEGYDQFGFDSDGLDQDGFDRQGFGRDGYNRDGFDRRGYDRDGYNREGLNRDGYNRDGYNRYGYNYDGFDRNGYDIDGFDVDGFDVDGFDRSGFDIDGYNIRGYDTDGFDRSGYDRYGYNAKGLDRYGNERPCDCYDCKLERGDASPIPNRQPSDMRVDYRDDPDSYIENNYGGDFTLRNYSYSPSPLIFRRSHGEDKKRTPYYGMEIEMTSRLTRRERRLAEEMGMDGDLLYFKCDGSVEGFEMVTHPMTAKWAIANFPWQVVEMMARAGATVNPNENGLHIHISRDGFTDEAHLYRFLKFWYRNQRPIENIAGRDGGSWGAFDPDQRKIHARHAKEKAKQRHARIKDGYLRSADTGQRYSAINLQPSNTVEVRLFASTTETEVLKTRFQLVAATVEYTRDLPVPKIRKGGWKWDSFMMWLDEHTDTYPELSERETSAIEAAIRRNNQPVLTLA